MFRKGWVCLVLAAALWAGEPKAARLYKEGKQAEQSGDVVRAYLLYSQAAALDANHPEYWLRAQALRTRAALKAKPMPVSVEKGSSALAAAAVEAPQPVLPGFSTSISPEELDEIARMRPPPVLKPTPGKRSLELRGDAKTLFITVAAQFGLGTVFDPDYEVGRSLHLQLDDVDYRGALHALEAATNSFVFPVGERLIMVAKDTPAKRTELEPTITVTVPLPNTINPQEAQELGRAVQQVLEIQRLAVDTTRFQVLIKDRISKVRPAQALFEQLAIHRPVVSIELEFMEVNRSDLLSYGLLMPTQFPLYYLGSNYSTGAVQSLARLFAGHTIIGLGIADSQLFATMTKSDAKNLLQTQVRALDGEAATFHVGDKYPIQTAGFLGANSAIAPSFNFEDLGLLMKVTPHVHGTDEVSLDVSAEFKVLGGEAINGVPVISNRKLESKVRVKTGQWAIVAGLLSSTNSKDITGLPGLVRLPFLRKNTVNRSSTDVVLLIKPTLLSLPPDQSLTRELWVGSDARLDIPL